MVDQEFINELKDHFSERFDLLQVRINERFELSDQRLQMQFLGCQQLCFEKIDHVEEKTEKAHERLDKHKSSIECLDGFKNKSIGFQKAIAAFVGLITVGLAYLEFKE